jgi:hypothetical protein
MNGCKTLGDEQKTLGAPVEYVIYHATHVWDMRELEPSDWGTNDYGQVVKYTYNAEVTEQSAKDAFAFFDPTSESSIGEKEGPYIVIQRLIRAVLLAVAKQPTPRRSAKPP